MSRSFSPAPLPATPYSRYAQPGTSVGIVCITADRAIAEEVGTEFASRLDAIGIDTRLVLWADVTRWADLNRRHGSPYRRPPESGSQRRPSCLAARSRPPAESHSRPTLVRDREPISKLLPDARESAKASTPRVEGRWALGRLLRLHADGVRLTHNDVARLLVAIDSIRIRDSLWTDISRETVTSRVALWTDMTRRAPDEVRAAQASLLRFAAVRAATARWRGAPSTRFPSDKPYAPRQTRRGGGPRRNAAA